MSEANRLDHDVKMIAVQIQKIITDTYYEAIDSGWNDAVEEILRYPEVQANEALKKKIQEMKSQKK